MVNLGTEKSKENSGRQITGNKAAKQKLFGQRPGVVQYGG
jgi:hypothetical protein